jgi:hypothetical protein
MASLDQSTLEAVNNTNYKVLGEAPAYLMGQAFSDSVDHRRRVNALAEAYLGQALKAMVEVDPSEAISQVKQLTGNDLAAQVSQLAAAVASIQQYVKAAQSTPRETGKD